MMTKNNTISVNLNFHPHTKQKEIIEKIQDDSIFCIVGCAGRQSGKTKLLETLLVYLANKEKNRHLIVLPTESQLRKLYNQILKTTEPARQFLIKKALSSPGDMKILFKNGSELIFRSAAAGDSIRGLTVNYLWIDEAAFIKKDVLEYILLPTLTVAGKKLIMFSTPKGKNFFFDYFYKKSDKFASIKFTSYDNPVANKEFIQLQKELLPDVIFRQEYLAEFVDAESIFENVSKLCSLKEQVPHSNEIYYAGIDVGLVNDSTVLSIFNQKKEQVFVLQWEKIDTNILVDQLYNILIKWNIKKCLIETNGMGLPIYQLLKRKYNKLEEFGNYGKKKFEIINDLIFEINSGNIKLINEPEQIIQFENFQYFNGNKFGAAYGYHDDYVMSVAIANYAMKNWMKKGNYMVI